MPPVSIMDENDAVHAGPTISELMASKLNDGWTRFARSCIVCQTPLIQPPPRGVTNKPTEGPETTKNPLSKEKSRPGIPFCVSCKSHVITDVSMLAQVQELEDKHGDSWVTGSILIDIDNSGDSENIKEILSKPSKEFDEPYVEDSREEAVQQEKKPKNQTLHSKLEKQEKEAEEYRIKQLREANKKRIEAEEKLRKERLEAMRKEEEGRKEAQLRRQMDEIRETEQMKLEQTESRLKQLKADEELRIRAEEESRMKDERDLMNRVMSESADATEDDYHTRRAIATKVLGAKMLHGYILKETQCNICEMPLMEKDGKMDCVVCPVLAKKAKKKKKIAEVESETEKISKMKLAAANLTTQEANFALMLHQRRMMENIESVKSDISTTPSVEAAARAQEEKYMALLEQAKTTGLQEAKQEKYMKELAEAMAGPTFPVEEKPREPIKPIVPVANNNLSPDAVVNFVKTTRQVISPEEEAELRFAEEEALHKVMLDERKAERERLLAENRRVEALRLYEKERAMVEQQQKEAEKTAILEAKNERIRRAREEEMRMTEKLKKDEEEHKASVRGVLDSLNSPKDRIVDHVGKVAEESKQKAEKAADLAQIALDHLSSVQSKLFHDSVNQATEMAFVEMNELLAKENGVSYKPEITMKEIQQVEVVNPFPHPVKINEDTEKSNPPINPSPTPSTTVGPMALNSADNESSDMPQGQAVLDVLESTISKSGKVEALADPPKQEIVVKNNVVESFALEKQEKATTETLEEKEEVAPVITTDNVESVTLKSTTKPIEKEKETLKETEQESKSVTTTTSNSAIRAPSPARSLLSARSQKSVRKTNDEEFAAKRAFVSKEIGQKMIQGWTLLDVACPFCVMPLMTEKSGGEHICVLCGNLEVKKKEEERKEKERTKTIEEQKLKEETERLKKKHEEMMKEEEELRLKREKEEAKKKALAEKKRADDEAIRSRVEAEVKKREEEIKNDLKETEERVRMNSQNMSEELQRSAERERLVAERKRFAEIVNEVKKIEEVRKKQEEEDARSVDSRRSRFSQDSRRSRQSAIPKVNSINDADDASVGGVSIQFPPDFDYDDEDAIRQVISLAKLKNKTSPTKPSAPPTSISFISSSPPETPTKKKAHLPPAHSGERRKPLIPPVNKSSPVHYVSPLQRDHAKLTTDNEEFDDGVSNMSMGSMRKTDKDEKTVETEKEKREARRASILNRLKRASSPSLRPERSSTPTSARRAALSSRVAELRSRSLTRAPRNPESTSVQDGSSRRSSYRERSESLKKMISKNTSATTGNEDSSVHSPKSVHTSSSRRSTLDDILSKIENAKAQLSKK